MLGCLLFQKRGPAPIGKGVRPSNDSRVERGRPTLCFAGRGWTATSNDGAPRRRATARKLPELEWADLAEEGASEHVRRGRNPGRGIAEILRSNCDTQWLRPAGCPR